MGQISRALIGVLRAPCARAALCALLALGVGASRARAVSLQELVRLKGQGKSELRGIGLVVGLPGTGDSAKDLVVARPLAKLLENEGNPTARFEELSQSKSIALVAVRCEVPETGAKASDELDVFVSALNNPKSLAGGQLLLSPLRGPLPGQPAYAIASGQVVIEGANNNSGRVRGGAKVIEDIEMPTISQDGTITLIVDTSVANWTTSQLIASTVNQHRLSFDERATDIARAMDDRSVRVMIPAAEQLSPANFISDILSIRFDPSLLDLPARVICNEREGAIVVTGDVEISPTLITHGDLVITLTTPAPEPSAQNPTTERTKWAVVNTTGRPRERARLQDLLTAFKQLDVPVTDQIAILNMLHKSGKLHAELVVD